MGRARQVAGSRILITGASQGIGRALALSAAARGGRVLAVARSGELLDQLAHEAKSRGYTLEVQVGDITNPDDRARMILRCRELFDGLDVLVNNAGVGATGHFAEGKPEVLRQIMEVNFFGTSEMIRAALPLLRQSDRAAVVNISSIAGKRGLPARSEYCASKFAVQGLSQALRAEFVKLGIHVLTVCPGLTQTNFSQNLLDRRALMQYDHMRGMTAEEVAEATWDALERGKREIWLTFNGKLLIWANRLMPFLVNWVTALMVRRLFHAERRARRTQHAQTTKSQHQPAQTRP